MPAKKTTTAKERYHIKIVEYFGNPDNEPPTREFLAVSVLGLKHGTQLYQHFTPDEIYEMEREGLEIRRKKYAGALAKIDKGMLEIAAKDPQAAKLMYQRFEGWSEKQQVENTHKILVEID